MKRIVRGLSRSSRTSPAGQPTTQICIRVQKHDDFATDIHNYPGAGDICKIRQYYLDTDDITKAGRGICVATTTKIGEGRYRNTIINAYLDPHNKISGGAQLEWISVTTYAQNAPQILMCVSFLNPDLDNARAGYIFVSDDLGRTWYTESTIYSEIVRTPVSVDTLLVRIGSSYITTHP